ncbi:MAG: hypothetical protein ABL964_17695 [Steroidobacteraceae bacterium]
MNGYLRAVLLCALTAGTALAEPVDFTRGALIIPMESTFQTITGQVSAYGLVYRILQANLSGHRNAASPVTVYIINDTGKQSPNRCKPTNTAALTASVVDPTNTAWNDGCDVHLVNNTEQPVVQVDYTATTYPASG